MNTARRILEATGLRIWKNKTLNQMTDKECEECLAFIQSATRTYYVGY